MRTIIKNPILEFNMILFPIWVGLSYLIFKSFFVNEKLAFLIAMLIFGETHFASTYLFYFKKNLACHGESGSSGKDNLGPRWREIFYPQKIFYLRIEFRLFPIGRPTNWKTRGNLPAASHARFPATENLGAAGWGMWGIGRVVEFLCCEQLTRRVGRSRLEIPSRARTRRWSCRQRSDSAPFDAIGAYAGARSSPSSCAPSAASFSCRRRSFSQCRRSTDALRRSVANR